jgi:large-conductance mechanosensitive channel
MANNVKTRRRKPISNIRFESAKSRRQPKATKSEVVVNVAQNISPVSGFLDFLKENAVMGLIIGYVLGTQVQALVKQLVASFLDPLTRLLFGTALSQRTFTLQLHGRYANFGWGALVYSVVIFLLVLLTMYLVIRSLKLEKLDVNKKEN